MKRLFLCLGALTVPPAAALSAAMVAEGLFGWGAGAYWTLGVIGGLAGLWVMVMTWGFSRDLIESDNGERFVGLIWVVLCAGAVVLAAHDLGWHQIRRQHNWEDWQHTTGRITGGFVTSFHRRGNPHFGHTTDFGFEFMVDGLHFFGSDRESGQGAIGGAIHVWFNPRDPSQNVASMNSSASPLPARGVLPNYYLFSGLLAAFSAVMFALACATPWRDGWWLPLLTALLIAGAYVGGAKLGEHRAVRKASVIEHPNPAEGGEGERDKELVELWRRSYAENLPAWRGRLPIQWMLALTRKEGKEREEAFDTIDSITTADRDAIPVLLELLPFGIGGAKKALVQIGSPSVPALISSVNGPHPEKRITAVETLGEFPADAATIAPILLELIAKRDPPLVRTSVESLGKLAAKSNLAIELLIQQLNQANPVAIHEAIHQVSRLGPRGKAAEKSLMELASDIRFQDGATKALQSIRGENPPAP